MSEDIEFLLTGCALSARHLPDAERLGAAIEALDKECLQIVNAETFDQDAWIRAAGRRQLLQSALVWRQAIQRAVEQGVIE